MRGCVDKGWGMGGMVLRGGKDTIFFELKRMRGCEDWVSCEAFVGFDCGFVSLMSATTIAVVMSTECEI